MLLSQFSKYGNTFGQSYNTRENEIMVSSITTIFFFFDGQVIKFPKVWSCSREPSVHRSFATTAASLKKKTEIPNPVGRLIKTSANDSVLGHW